MGCLGAGTYNPGDTTVVAVGPALYDQFPCGARVEVCGPNGCITGTRKDSCPGCASSEIDLSRAGFDVVCGAAANSCGVQIKKLP